LAHPANPAEAPRSPPLSAVLTEAGGAIRMVTAGRSLTDVLAKVPAALRPATMDLAYGAIRHLARYRFFLDQLLKRPATDAEIPGLLLAALHALQSRPQESHMVVDQAVTAAASIKHGAAKGLVNAVLRNFLRQGVALAQTADQNLVTRYSYPSWWIARLQRAYPKCWESILSAGNEHPPMSLRVNRGRISAGAYLEQLKNQGIEGSQCRSLARFCRRPGLGTGFWRAICGADAGCARRHAGARRLRRARWQNRTFARTCKCRINGGRYRRNQARAGAPDSR
jgi:16S rRNA (cytosine967-C5)-methyltransferase